MSDQVEKKYEPLETTKHTEDNSIIEEKLPHHANGETVRRYAKGKLLGKGGFAKCFEATNLDSKKMSAITNTLWLILLALFRMSMKN